MTDNRFPPTPGIQTAVRKVLSGLRYEPHIPHGSGDAEYHLVNDQGQAVALIDPGMIFDDAADVAESIVLAVRSDAAPDMLAALKEAQRMVGAYVLILERGGNETDATHARYVERQIAEVIAKAEG